MRSMLCIVGIGLGLLLAAAPSKAHHAFSSEFDALKPVKLQGTVTRVDWVNPHCWILIDVKTQGKVVNWRLETGPPSEMMGRGFTKNSLVPGMEIIVTAFEAKHRAHTARAIQIFRLPAHQ